LCPAPRYAELFARTERAGWDCHGDEVRHSDAGGVP
jgi:N6-adenosine-specific RNA methylase IME4